MSGFNGAVEGGALHGYDVVDNLTSTDTDKPVSANIVNTVTASNISFETQSYYSLVTSGANNKIVRNGKHITIQMVVTCVSPYDTAPGIAVINNVPSNPVGAYMFASVAPSGISTAGKSLRVAISNETTPKLYLRNGAAGLTYDILITYITP